MIDWVNTVSISVSMSLDACSVNAANGIKEENIKPIKLVLISLCFGVAQFLMPLIGYLVGLSFKQYIESFIPWIAFGLLLLLSIKSLIDWLKEIKQKDEKEVQKEKRIKISEILIQTIATSIDALCIGFVYIDSPITEALIIFTVIGLITWALSFLTGFFSKYLSKLLNKWSCLIASIVFFAIGLKILLEGIL